MAAGSGTVGILLLIRVALVVKCARRGDSAHADLLHIRDEVDAGEVDGRGNSTQEKASPVMTNLFWPFLARAND